MTFPVPRRSLLSLVESKGLAAILTLLAAGALAAEEANPAPLNEGRNSDARVAHNSARQVTPKPSQLKAEADLRRVVSDAAVTYDSATGAARTLMHRTGYLTEGGSPPANYGDALRLGMDFAHQYRDLLGLTELDMAGPEISDEVLSRPTGAWHIYLRQVHDGLAVYNGQLQFNVNRDGKLISLNNSFLPDLASAINTSQPGLTSVQAVELAAEDLNLDSDAEIRVEQEGSGRRQQGLLKAPGISTEDISTELMWLPIQEGQARLVWNFQIATLDREHWFDLTVDAVTGQIWTRFDWIASADYRVYPRPVESPHFTTPLPPADARVVETDPHDAVASPFGWHDTDGVAGNEFTIPRGNNTHTYEDRDANNAPPGVQPDCGASIDCDFPMDLSMEPSTYTDASVIDLFYWTNVIHDVQYQYGFDEVGGNFQVNNYGNGGLGNDDVQAEAQDGAGTNNANFGTPPDGGRPRMQMFEFTLSTPRRDGTLDHGIVTHEYGHGISNRQVGGPSNVSCLGNTQQPGEGWSDWLGLAYTGEVGDAGTDIRGAGTYVLNQPTDGPGVRPQPYSTDPAVNSYTYESISGIGVPHGLGSVWAQAIWEVYWALVDQHGFDLNIYDALGGAGNQRAMLYVNEGLKNTVCGPSFLDTRDAIIQAATDNYGGVDVCLVWGAFADFGLGANASTPGPGSTSATNGFDLPASCASLFSDGFESGDTSAWSLTFP